MDHLPSTEDFTLSDKHEKLEIYGETHRTEFRDLSVLNITDTPPVARYGHPCAQ